MISKKTAMFTAWLAKCFGRPCKEEDQKFLIDLEVAARLAVHDLDTMGELDHKTRHALIRASKNLQEAYAQNKSS